MEITTTAKTLPAFVSQRKTLTSHTMKFLVPFSFFDTTAYDEKHMGLTRRGNIL